MTIYTRVYCVLKHPMDCTDHRRCSNMHISPCHVCGAHSFEGDILFLLVLRGSIKRQFAIFADQPSIHPIDNQITINEPSLVSLATVNHDLK